MSLYIVPASAFTQTVCRTADRILLTRACCEPSGRMRTTHNWIVEHRQLTLKILHELLLHARRRFKRIRSHTCDALRHVNKCLAALSPERKRRRLLHRLQRLRQDGCRRGTQSRLAETAALASQQMGAGPRYGMLASIALSRLCRSTQLNPLPGHQTRWELGRPASHAG